MSGTLHHPNIGSPAAGSGRSGLSRVAAAEGLLARVEARFVQLLMVVLLVVGVAQVVVRSAGQRSLGTDEITTMTMAVLVFVGSGVVVYTAEYIAIEILEFIKKESLQKVFRMAGMVATAVFAVVFGYYSWDLMSRIGWEEKTLQLGLPLAISAAAMVVGAVLMLLHTVGNGLRLVLGEERYRDPHRAALLVDETAEVE